MESKIIYRKPLIRKYWHRKACEVLDVNGISTCITTASNNLLQKIAILRPANKDYRIRKLTPKECFRLMGMKDADFEKIAVNQSNSSLYHLAGDSIVVTVLEAIFKQMIQVKV